MWWNTAHPLRSGEALAAAADLAARLYQATGEATYLNAADKYIGWANKHLLQVHGVYLRTASTPYPYLIEPKTPQEPTTPTRNFVGKCPPGPGGCKQGRVISKRLGRHHQPSNSKPTMVAMPHDGEGAMLAAITTLCEATGNQSWCKATEKLAAAEIVWLAPFSDGPQYDSVLVRGLLTLYAHDHNALLVSVRRGHRPADSNPRQDRPGRLPARVGRSPGPQLSTGDAADRRGQHRRVRRPGDGRSSLLSDR